MLEFAVRSDVVILGRNWEDNSPIFGEAFYVIAQAADGTRHRHFHTFVSHERLRNDDPEYEGQFYFRDRFEEAKAAAYRFLARVEARKLIDMKYWNEIEPEYGSDAYIATDAEGELLEWERRIDEDSRFDLAFVA